MLSLTVNAADLTTAQMDSIANVRSAAIAAYRQREPQKAANLYRQSIALGDSSIVPFYNLACCYGRLHKLDSCQMALQTALDHGYPDYMELGTDADLLPLQSLSCWRQLWQKAFNNSFGKIVAKQFDGLALQMMLNADTARLRFLLSPERKTDSQVKEIGKTLVAVDSLLQFSGITTDKQLFEKRHLRRRELTYTSNHFVAHDEFIYALPVPYFDADFAQLIANDTLHLRMRTFDHLYSYLDTVFLEKSVVNEKVLPALTDSIMLLEIKSKGEQIDDYQGKVSRNAKQCDDVLKKLQTAELISAAEFQRLQPQTGDIYFIRLNNLPVRKQFSGIKVASYKGSRVALVVADGKYYFVKTKKAF